MKPDMAAISAARTKSGPVVRRKKGFFHKYGVGLAFTLPFLVLFVIFVIAPIVVAIVTSFTNYDMIGQFDFVGISNYMELFTTDDIFVKALQNTLFFAVIAGPVGYIMSFVMAWILNQLKFRNLFSLAFYAPSITSAVALSVVWLYFFSPDRYGFINNALFNLGVITEPILWTSDPNTIMLVVVFVSIWMSMGNGFLVFLAGLQNVSKELYEAGRVDGVRNKFQELFYLTLPQMKPQLLFGAINSISASFAVFDVPVALVGMPSPDYAAHTLVAHIYDYAFIRFQMGYSSAVAVVLFALTFILGRIFFRLLSSKDEV